jgi:hypothetical protein
VLPGHVVMVPVGRRKLPRVSLSAGGFVFFWYLFMKYHRVNGSLLGGAYPLARSGCYEACSPDDAASVGDGIDSHSSARCEGRVAS